MHESGKQNLSISTASWVKGVVVILVTLGLFILRDLLLVVIASIVIASAIEPATAWARRRGIPRLPSVLFVYITSAIILAGLFYFLFLPLLGETANFLKAFPEYSQAIVNDPVFSSASGIGSVFSNVSKAFSVQDILDHVNILVSTLSNGLFSSVSIVFGGVFSFVLIIVLSFYLSVQEDGVGKFLKIATPVRQEKYIVNLWKRSQAKIGLWMQGQILLAVIVAVLVYLGLLLVGIPHALLLAVSAGIFEIIPLFGPILAAIPAVLVAFSAGSMPEALIVAGLFLVIQQFENQLIYPLVVKKVVGVPPMVAILALLVGFKLAGFLGVLISVPMATILIEFISDVEQSKVSKSSETA